MAGQDSQSADDSFALRQASTFFEKFNRDECQELLSFISTHFLLSTDDFKVPTEPPLGIITGMKPLQEFCCMFLMPCEEGIEMLDLREVHQIVRELTFGIFVLNQLPSIALEANFDESTSCRLPPAYIDTRVGQILINVDYIMKGLWHGAYFPRDKRSKFSERWRGNLDVNSNGKPETKKPLLTEFTSAGMLDVTSDPDWREIYDKLPEDQPGDIEAAEEKRFFMNNVDGLSMQMTLFQDSIKQHRNLFVMDPDYLISSVVHLTEDRIDKLGYERLHAKLQLHEIMLKQSLPNKAEVRQQLYLLKVVSFLVPFLIGMKKRMRIPDLGKMLPNLTADECKTEKELPPLMLSQDFKCKNFNFGNHYFNLHGGIQVDYETPEPTELSEEIQAGFEEIQEETLAFLRKWLDPNAPLQETYPAPTKDFNGKTYYAFALEFETYYSQSPQKPKWVHVMCEEISKLKPKRFPVQESQIFELFKKYFGLKKAMKYKNVQHGLKAASQRGLIAAFQTLSRKCPPVRLAKQDELGMGLVHYAAMYNRPNILAVCIMLAMDVNVKRNTNFVATDPSYSNYKPGPSPLHLAARCGSYDACACLLANYANILATDAEGWTPIHHAAYFDHEPILKLIIRKNDGLIELQTKNDIGSTPLLLAASSGALSALRCLLRMGAYILRVDEEGNNLIHLAALRFHTNILEYFIEWNHPDIDVWGILVGMIREDDEEKKDAAVKCLEPLSTSSEEHWKAILAADGVSALVDLLKVPNEDLQSVAASVLCNISEHDEVRDALTKATAGPILIQLLSSPVDEIQSRAAIVLSDLACIEDNQDTIATQGGIPALVNLLDSELEDVLVNAVNAVRVMCTDNTANQNAVAAEGGIDSLVEFLSVPSDILQAASAAAIAALCTNNPDNQNAVVAEGAVKPIVQLIRGRNVTVQVKAAAALEALADHNANSQKAFLALDAPKALMRLLKVWSIEVKEQGACALWSLAGQTKTQQKDIAERIGISQLIEILLLSSEKLQYVGCLGMTALGREDVDSQNRISEQGGIQPLVRLLRSHKTSERVLLTVIKVLGTLCVGVAHKNNKVTQAKIAEEHAIPNLVQLLVNPLSEQIQVEVAYALGCVVLSNRDNQEKLREESGFKFRILLDLLQRPDEEIRLSAGLALAIFAFNNTPQQYSIREAGGVRFSVFNHFLQSDNDINICHAAFQVVVLARVIVDRDQVELTAIGVSALVNILRGDRHDNAVILASSLIASLAHTRAGIPDALTTVGAIDLLIERLYSENDQVRFASATAVGYLTYNRTAARLLLTACRNTPGLYEIFIDNAGKSPRISPDFREEFERHKIIGLPCLSLQMHGGPPIDPHQTRPVSRPRTAVPTARSKLRPATTAQLDAPGPPARTRVKSAPAHRTKTPATPNTVTANKKEGSYAFFKSQLKAWKD